MIKFNINTDDVAGYTRRLERIGKTQLPRTVGATLNALAFESKKEIPNTFKKKGFNERNKRFSKFFARSQNVKTFNIKKMKSFVGFADVNNSKASESMSDHETGGKIENKLITSNFARVGKNKSKGKQNKNKLKNLGKIPTRGSIKYVKKGNMKRFFSVGKKIASQKGIMVLETKKGNAIVRIESYNKKRKRKLKTSLLYWERKGATNVKGRHTVSDSAVKTSRKKSDKIFIEKAKRFIK